jgi:hypothetical protein
VKRIAMVAAVLVLLSLSFSLAGSETVATGTYVNKADKEYLTLNADGTFYIKLRKKPADPVDPFLNTYGIYRMNGDVVELELEGGGEASGSIKGSNFIDNEGKTWVKEGTSTPPPMEVSPKKGLRSK